jgi:hypothetical protein
MLDTSSSVLETVLKKFLDNLAHPAHKVHAKAQLKMAYTFIPIAEVKAYISDRLLVASSYCSNSVVMKQC